jgi:pyruvate dehydrogenase E1 component alpha subunit
MMIHYLDENGVLTPTFSTPIEDERLLRIYRTMRLTRLVDERMTTLQRQGLISFALTSLGEEACGVASAAALEMEDWMYPQYREAGIIFWRGFSVEQFVHQMFGDGKDLTLGRQMPNHFGDRKLNVVTVSSPIGTNIPQAAGCAYAMKLQGGATVAIAYFGEGATSESDFHVGLNIAAVRKCPVIFFCRNNGYAISTPSSSQYASDGIAIKGQGYGITSFCVDGNDVFAVYEVVKKAKAECLAGKGPVLIEAITYRMGAHSTSDDPSQYRKEEDVKKWESKCPILRLRRYLESKNLWDEKKEETLFRDVENELNLAITAAKETAPPSRESLIEDVYSSVPRKLKEELEDASHEHDSSP